MYPQPTGEIKDIDDFIKRAKREREQKFGLVITIINKTTGEFIGGGGIHRLDKKIPSFGIWIKKSSHGNKYGKEAVEGLKKWAEKNFEYEEFNYSAVVHNTPSKKIATSLGGFVIAIKPFFNSAGEKLEITTYRIPINS